MKTDYCWPEGWKENTGCNTPYLIGGSAEFAAEVREAEEPGGGNPATQRPFIL